MEPTKSAVEIILRDMETTPFAVGLPTIRDWAAKIRAALTTAGYRIDRDEWHEFRGAPGDSRYCGICAELEENHGKAPAVLAPETPSKFENQPKDPNGHIPLSRQKFTSCKLCGLVLPAMSQCRGSVQVKLRTAAQGQEGKGTEGAARCLDCHAPINEVPGNRHYCFSRPGEGKQGIPQGEA